MRKTAIFRALETVFRNTRYVILTGAVAFVIFLFSVWLPNIKLIAIIARTPDVGIVDLFRLLGGLMGSIATNFTPISAGATIAVALLVGINISFIVYYYRSVRVDGRTLTGGGTIGGLLFGILGVGCASCGSFLLTALLGTFASSLLLFLPLHGAEFGLIAVGILLFTIFRLAKKIDTGLVCEPKKA